MTTNTFALVVADALIHLAINVKRKLNMRAFRKFTNGGGGGKVEAPAAPAAAAPAPPPAENTGPDPAMQAEIERQRQTRFKAGQLAENETTGNANETTGSAPTTPTDTTGGKTILGA